jgi:AcrR family transcriptional regulator
MTEKQEKILDAARWLFAEEGYKATSTQKVARKAGVSEGLIFRHFNNKEGLLHAILAQGELEAQKLFAHIISEKEPLETVRKTLLLGQKIMQTPEMAAFWKLQYKIKWEMEEYGAHKTKALLETLSRAFQKLGYENPEWEAETLLTYLDGLAMRYFLQDDFDLKAQIEHLMAKYNV